MVPNGEIMKAKTSSQSVNLPSVQPLMKPANINAILYTIPSHNILFNLVIICVLLNKYL